MSSRIESRSETPGAATVTISSGMSSGLILSVGKFFFLAAIALCFGHLPAQAQTWSSILDYVPAGQKAVTQSGIDWSLVGLPSGVPSGSWTQCGATILASDYGNGTVDATSAINNALNACGSNQYVLLGPGTFLFNSGPAGSPRIYVKKNNVELRGSGPNSTILKSTGSNQDGWIQVGSSADPDVSKDVSITGGATAGSTQITVSNAANFAVGKLVIITELNDTTQSNYVTPNANNPNTPSGDPGGCTYCDGLWNGTRDRSQTVEVVSVSGNTIGISPPLYTDYNQTPHALPYSVVRGSGVKNLQVYGNRTHTANRNGMIVLYSCAYCWAQNIVYNYPDGDYAKFYWSIRSDIRDSYMSNGFNHGPGSDNGCVLMAFKSSANKVENNIFERAENVVMVYMGASGNIISYNYSTGSWACSGCSGSATVSAGMYHHSAHSQFNLFEGNIAQGTYVGSGHGSASQNTDFRNWYLGTGLICSNSVEPETRATISCSNSHWAADGARAIDVEGLSHYNNFVGNVIGSPAQNTLSGSKVAVLQWPSTRQYNGVSYGMTFGYTLFGDSGSNATWDNTASYSTSFIHGNFNFIDGSTNWATGVSHTLPASFYLSGRPSWWDSSIPFPAIGPDVTGGTIPSNAYGSSPGGHVYAIPAMACYYNVMGGAEGGPNSPLATFDPSTCYTASTGTSVQPPSGLAATVN